MRDGPLCTAMPVRLQLALPFLLVAAVAVVAGGSISAFLAHQPSRQVMWMVAYLVLVAGVAQALLGLGRAHFATAVPDWRRTLVECLVFNLANAAVIVGTLRSGPVLVVAGTMLFALVLVDFMGATFGKRRSRVLLGYRLVLLCLAIGAGTGVVMSLLRNLA